MSEIERLRRRASIWLMISAAALVITMALIASGHRTPASWLTLAATSAGFMTWFLLWRKYRRTG